MTDDSQLLQSIREGEKNLSPPLQTAPNDDQSLENRMPSTRQREGRAVRRRGLGTAAATACAVNPGDVMNQPSEATYRCAALG